MDDTGPLILCNPQDLQERLKRDGALGPALRVVDLRWAASGPTSRQRYDAGHIPGAVFCDLDRDLSHAQPRGPGGRHPLNTVEELAQSLSRLGIAEETDVVVYDEGNGSIAARLWLQLRLHGHRRVQLLDGGLWAWTKVGLPLETAESHAAAAPLRKLVRDGSMLVDRPRIAALVASRGSKDRSAPLLFDARAPERYRGEIEPLDRIPGHIPGAINAPFSRFLRAPDDPRWRSNEEVRSILTALGADGREIIASCGSGVTGCHTLMALDYAGAPEGKLYVGSYSDWVSDLDAEVSVGSEP